MSLVLAFGRLHFGHLAALIMPLGICVGFTGCSDSSANEAQKKYTGPGHYELGELWGGDGSVTEFTDPKTGRRFLIFYRCKVLHDYHPVMCVVEATPVSK